MVIHYFLFSSRRKERRALLWSGRGPERRAKCAAPIPAQPILQLQVGEQLHLSPQLQPLVWPVVFSFWQPHLQAEPAQDAHLQCFDFIDIGNSFFTLSWIALGCANN
jgi:hypothetical protein